MIARRTLTVVVVSATLTGGISGAADAAGSYGDCTSLRRAYANGVASSGSAAQHPSPSWIKIRPPVVSYSVYAASKRLDRDRDGIACEVSR